MKNRFDAWMTMTRGSILIGGVVGTLALGACAPESPRKFAPPQVYSTVAEKAAPGAKIDWKPKVDILFVVDTSDSMVKHQQNLKDNVDRFVEAFEKHKDLDFQIGVVSVFDSQRFGAGKAVPEGKFYPLGQLRPLKDPAHPGENVVGPQYVTRSERYNQVLGETLKVGIEQRCETVADAKGRSTCVDAYGPEFEESFSPVMEVVAGNRNPGFIRPDAHLAVIMITDANDDSTISPSHLEYVLRKAKGGDRSKYSTYAVLALDVKEVIGGKETVKKCAQDPGGAPTRILDFVALTGGSKYSLCDSKFGDNLAEAGRTIRAKASRLKIDLKAIPEDGTLAVKFGGQPVPQDKKTGWTYEAGSIIISGEAELSGPEGSQLEIDYIPVDPRDIGTDRVRSATN